MPAPKKPTAKAAKKPTPAKKAAPAKAAKVAAPKAETKAMEETTKSCGCGPNCQCGPNCDCGPDCQCGDDCECGTEPLMGCHVAGLLAKRITWVSAITSLAILWFTNALTHGWWLMARYQETSTLWLPQNEMKFGLILLSEIITALAVTLIFRLAYRGYGYVEGAKLGILAMLPMAGAASLMTIATQPIPADIALTWGISQLMQGALVGLALAGISKCPPAHGGCGSAGSCCSKESDSSCCKK